MTDEAAKKAIRQIFDRLATSEDALQAIRKEVDMLLLNPGMDLLKGIQRIDWLVSSALERAGE